MEKSTRMKPRHDYGLAMSEPGVRLWGIHKLSIIDRYDRDKSPRRADDQHTIPSMIFFDVNVPTIRQNHVTDEFKKCTTIER